MGTSGIYRVSGEIAVFIAIAALLLQAVCPAQFVSAATVSLAQPVDSGCHESNPSSPDSPNSEKKCCNGQHYPEVLLKPAQPAPALVAAAQLEAPPLFIPIMNHRYTLSRIASGPPGPFVLRI